MTPEFTRSGPVTFAKTSLMQIVCDHFGLKKLTGTYMCWDPQGFMFFVDGYDLPVSVITREFSFDDYPGDSEPDKDGRIVHVIGRFDEEAYCIHGSNLWFEGEEPPV